MSRLTDSIEGDALFFQTYAASTHNVVASMLAGAKEMKALAARSAASDRDLEERARAIIARPAAQRMPLIAYAILLQGRRAASAVPLRADDLRSLPDAEAAASLRPWHPFYYVVDALATITGAPPPSPGRALFAERLTIADNAERWHRQAAAPSTGPRCPKCGHAITPGKRFCTACGAAVV